MWSPVSSVEWDYAVSKIAQPLNWLRPVGEILSYYFWNANCFSLPNVPVSVSAFGESLGEGRRQVPVRRTVQSVGLCRVSGNPELCVWGECSFPAFQQERAFFSSTLTSTGLTMTLNHSWGFFPWNFFQGKRFVLTIKSFCVAFKI